MDKYKSTNEQNFKNYFLKLLLILINVPNKGEETNIESKEKEFFYPGANELDIAIEIQKNNQNSLLYPLAENENNFLVKIITEYNYSVSLFLKEFNEQLKNHCLISLYDIFCFSLLCVKKYDSLLKEIKNNYEYIQDWLIALINFTPIYEACKNIGIFNKFINDIQSILIKNKNEIKNKYYAKYKSGQFIEPNGKTILNMIKKNFKEEKIYWFFSGESSNILTITEKTDIYEYENENNINDLNMPFSFNGKVMEKIDNTYILLSNDIKQIIYLDDKENIMKNIKINEFRYFYAMKITDVYQTNIYIESTKISEIAPLPPENRENSINSINNKILMKFNFIDYKYENYYNYIGFQNDNKFITLKINNNYIYYAYEENEITNEYFPQNIVLSNENIKSPYKILMYKGYCNEINIFINKKGGFAYDYYYICKDKNIVPKRVKIQFEKEDYSFDNFWRYDTTKRYKITFVNIPNQGINITGYNSFLKISSIIDSQTYIDYGTFLLKEIKIEKLEKIKINNDLKELIFNIEKDVTSFINGGISIKYLKDNYLKEEDKKKYNNEFSYDYRDFYFHNDIEYFNYFNKLCIWKILTQIEEKYWIFILPPYFSHLEEIKNSNLDNKDKTILLITLVRRLLENNIEKIPQVFPKIIFFNTIKEKNHIDYCYREAYDFHLNLIDSLTEDSILTLPFLQLNSYIMPMVLTEKDKELIKKSKIDRINISADTDESKKKLISDIEKEQLVTQNAYTISMLSIDTIKKHLKQTMKPYALIFEKSNTNEEFCACVYKDNNIICFNEDKIFEEITFYFFNLKSYRIQRCKDFAFILNMYFLHENSCHNKEKMYNNKIESPILFIDKDLITSVILCSKDNYIGEAGYFVESFITDRSTLLDLINCKNSFGDLLDMKYFNKKDFNDLILFYNSKFAKNEVSHKTTEQEEKNNKDNSLYNKINYNKKSAKKNIIRDNFGFTEEDYIRMEEARRKYCDY